MRTGAWLRSGPCPDAVVGAGGGLVCLNAVDLADSHVLFGAQADAEVGTHIGVWTSPPKRLDTEVLRLRRAR